MRIRIYTGLTIALAVAGVYWAAASTDLVSVRLLVALGLLSFLAEWLAFSIPMGGTVSLAFAVHYAAVLLGGPLMAALVALFGAISPQDIRARKPPIRMAFNAAQFALSSIAASAVYLALGGRPIYGAPPGELQQWLWPALAAAPIQALVNMALVGGAIALSSGVSLRQVWASIFRSYLVNMIALTLLGLILAQLIVVAGFVAVALLIVPFLVARQTFQVYRQQSDAYMSTVKSLVAAVEAKDSYTRGHSERVATLAAGIAQQLRLSSREVERITWAALLHDVGKIALSTGLLRKADPLTPEEFAAVRAHPELAAEILSSVDSLEEIVPLIAAHHEWFDGSGYPVGLAGDAIPFGARVLAVADSFDAMTSTRPYRPARPEDEAVGELVRGASIQFDPQCVDALLRALRTGQLQTTRDES